VVILQNKKHTIITLALLAMTIVLVSILYTGLNQNPNSTPMVLLNKKANDFKVSWLQGQEHLDNPRGLLALDDFKGKPLILNFWASWCVSCREEARLMEIFWRKYSPMGVKMVGIAVHDSPTAAMEFARYYGKTYILGLDENGNAGIEYGVTGVPETFFIDKSGLIRHKEAGPLTAELLEKHTAIIMK